MKMMKQMIVENNIAFLTLNSLHENQHNHIQNFVDRTKINKDVKNLLKTKVEKNIRLLTCTKRLKIFIEMSMSSF